MTEAAQYECSYHRTAYHATCMPATLQYSVAGNVYTGYVPLNRRYYLVTQNKNWTDANYYCDHEHHAKLVSIADQVDQLRLHTFLDGIAGIQLVVHSAVLY